MKAPYRLWCVYCHNPIRKGAACRIVPADAMRPEERNRHPLHRCAHEACAIEHGPSWMRSPAPRKPSAQRCKEPGCFKRVKARGWCSLHYNRWLRRREAA